MKRGKGNPFYTPYSFKYSHIERAVEWISRQPGIQPPLQVLDIGVDDTSYYPTLKKLGPLTTLDPFPESGADVIADICRCDFADNAFDVIFLLYVLEHLKTPDAALAECRRVIRPGGYLAGIVPQYWHTHGYPSDYWRFTQFGISQLLESCGLELLTIWPMGGPFLIAFHAVEIALKLRRADSPFRVFAYNSLGRLLDAADRRLTNHGEKEGQADCVAWCFIARNPKGQQESSSANHFVT